MTGPVNWTEVLHAEAVFDGVDADACGFSGPHRLVTANWDLDQSYLINLQPTNFGRYKRPFRKELRELKRLVEEKALIQTTFDIPAEMRKYNPANEADEQVIKKLLENANEITRSFILDDEAARRNSARLRIIEEILNPGMTELLLECGQLGTYVKRWSGAAGTEVWRVYQLTYRFWVYEKLPQALITDHWRCGVRADGKPRKVTKKLGAQNVFVRTKTDLTKEGVNAEQYADLLHKGYVLFKKKYKGNLSKIFQETIRRFFNRGVEKRANGELVYKLPPAEEVPTYDQFYYWVDKEFGLVKRLFDKTPNTSHQKDLRGLTGKSTDDAPWSGHTYQIDSTTANVWLVSAYNSSWLIGRPIIYFVVDTASGCIVGVHITLGTPCWEAAALALYNAFSEKRAWLSHYGFDLAEGDQCFMPKAPIPRYVRADRAEMLSEAGRLTAKVMRFDLQFPGPYRPDLKPDVERIMLTSQTHYEWVLGAVLQRARERGERDYRLDSVFTLFEFTQIIIDFIRLYNLHAEKPSKLNDDARRMQPPIPPNPLHLWNFSIALEQGSPRYSTETTLIKEFFPSATATVTTLGVEYMGNVYRPHWEGPFAWGTKARQKQWRIPIAYHMARPDEIRCLNPETGEYEKLITKKSAEEMGHVQFEDIADKRVYEEIMERLRKPSAAQALSNSKSFVEGLQKKGLDRRRQAEEAGKALDAENVRGARAVEKAANAGMNIDELPDLVDSAAQASGSTTHTHSIYAYLMQERAKDASAE